MKIKTKSKVLLLLIVGLFQLSVFGQNFPASSVNIVLADMKMLSPVSWVSGTVISRNNSQIAAEVSGRLVSLSELGAKVKKGDLLAQIDDRNIQIQRLEYIASVKSAQSSLNYLESEVKRKSALAKRNLSAKTDLDETISKRDVAIGDLAAAEARLSQTKQNLAYTKLLAPFNGLVAERMSSLGEYVNNGTAIIRLIETDNLEATIYAPLTAYRFLKQSDSLAVESPLGKGIAKIKALVPAADARSHLMEVRMDMSAFDWPVGLNVKVAIAIGETKKVLAIPRDALVLRRDGISIFRINSDNSAEQIKVTIGIGAGELVEIIGDVNQGDQIVIRGAERLQTGQKVQIKENNNQLISGKQTAEQ